MKRFIYSALFCCLVYTNAGAQFLTQTPPAPLLPPLEDPEQVTLNRETPRTQLYSFNKKEFAMSGDTAASTYMQPLNGIWKVKRFNAPATIDSLEITANTASWAEITSPEQSGNNAWATIYRHDFKMPFAWIDRQVFAHIGPVSRAYYLYINGKLAGYHEDSKTPAEFDITKLIKEGKNYMAIVAYAQPASIQLENQDQSTGTVLTGDVYVFAQPKVRMRDYVIDARFAPDGTSGLFNFGVIVKSHLLNPKQVTVYYDLYGPDSTLVRSGKRDARFEMRLEDTVRFFENIPNIESWSHESPKLYTVALRIQHEGRFTDYTTLKVGFRDVQFSNDGITINGRPVTLRAIDYVCPKDETTLCKDLLNFHLAGINLLRVQQNPQPKWFYDQCDRYGMYVCDQTNLDTRLGGSSLKIGGTPTNDTIWQHAYTDRVLNMYHFSKNHPSVIMFSLGGDAGRGYNMYEAYLALKAVEKSRPVIYEGAGAEWNSDMVVGTPDGRNESDHRYTLHFATPAQWQATPVPPASINIEPIDIEHGKAMIRNGFTLANLLNFDVGFIVSNRSKEILRGRLASNIKPGGSAPVEAAFDGLKPGKYTLTIFVAHKDAMPWAKKGDRLAEHSYPLVISKQKK